MAELDDKYSIGEWAKASRLFSPLRGRRVWRFGDPVARDEVACASTKCPVIHWWQWWFRAAGLLRDLLPPKGSFLAEIFLQHGGQGHAHLDLETYRKIAASNKDKSQSMHSLTKRVPEMAQDAHSLGLSSLAGARALKAPARRDYGHSF